MLKTSNPSEVRLGNGESFDTTFTLKILEKYIGDHLLVIARDKNGKKFVIVNSIAQNPKNLIVDFCLSQPIAFSLQEITHCRFKILKTNEGEIWLIDNQNLIGFFSDETFLKSLEKARKCKVKISLFDLSKS
jgi:ABC-type phosphate transport system auxiliary subunit